MNTEIVGIVENIKKATSDEEVLRLWKKVTAQFSINEIVWAHKQVSNELIEVLSRLPEREY